MTVGGAQRVLLNLAGWLHHHSYPVTAAFFYDKDGLHQNWQQGAAFPIHDLQGWQAGGGLRGLLRLPGSLWRLFRLMRGGNCRAILTFTHHSNLLGIPMAWLAGVPIRIGTHRGRIESFPPWLERLHSIIINSTLCYCFLAVSEEIRNESMMEGIKKEKILVIPNAMEIPTVNSERITEFRHAFNLQSSDLCILSVGRLTIQKAHTYLLQAAKKVLLQFPQANVYIAGEGPLQDELETEVRTNDLLNNVHFLGVREDIFLLLAVTDIFVLSSRWEGMPNVLLEAMACGVPV
ncbi:MAG: glycosyltransferase, partial [Anaerolineaceae bacterium]|nr:glycosyltransferase [Anaerolineaceae bacterium]